ncbi:hypothetical protein DBB36_15665 [Flavobacterium sp. WLB]|uniref:DUF5367 family protein n=1 Tax=unclassified Flavobacterium TaxID=196869 RepID=UPI0006ABC855|nr:MULTISPECIES: DUF5367 family protein [unclassified Flavobacterium]OWU90326.1 hypothetical protein APR43_12250 [Flavobacterium sp. NLM]PUU69053.1 hypothetical protein DBB36_15665 [Flavobacterium sp. WLB]
MKYIRAIFSGILVWFAVSISFYILEQIPVVKDSFFWQSVIVAICIVFFAIGAAKFYYLRNYKMDGLKLGIIMSHTALFLDIIITVPFVEIPNGRNYESFFTSPILWILAFVNAVSVFLWRKLNKNVV